MSTTELVPTTPRRAGKHADMARHAATLLLERQNRHTGLRWRITVAPQGGVHVTETSHGAMVWEPSLAAALAWTDYLAAAQRFGPGERTTAALRRYLALSTHPGKV